MRRECVLEHVKLDSRITVSMKKRDADYFVRYDIRRPQSPKPSGFSLDLA